ncbi:iron-sulfur cluster assembly scaffold protein [Paracoccus sp. SCSIO 75233]|uniref:iron-sulfur cluster assembly scaffold protein n=1 Tax=Paracoccus sp. SCSIO 75233 TaxID=3017782 RepID=UPI0022F00BAE|nr:iron-sulfur cluster assembly scaffold protein [Paracoccus sp. SCSIO 75233]WBU52157.1 iron-sulfur cluster assembly scaffold protein [Paracoccus sp. SCSIO 75233]
MSDADMMQLYSKRILALAADIPHLGRIADPQGSAKKRSPHCGSTVTAHVRIEDGHVAAFGQEVRACALGQASAAVLGTHVMGATRAEIARGEAQLLAMLKETGPVPDAPWDGLEVLIPARDYPNRHASILLSWQAVLAAIDAAETQPESRAAGN